MPDSFFSRLKGKVQSAGKEAQRLAQLGQLKLDMTGAKTELDRSYRSLGRACANRLIDRGEAELSAEDPGLVQCVSEVRAARDKVTRIEEAIAELGHVSEARSDEAPSNEAPSNEAPPNEAASDETKANEKGNGHGSKADP